MEIDAALIKKVARIARLDLKDEEVQLFIPQFKEILDAFAVLRKADVSGLSPVFHPVEIPSRMRKDEPEQCLTQQQAVSLAPHAQDGYFKGPRIMK